MRESNTEITEDLTLATYSYPYVHTIITEIIDTFFPNLQSPFTHKDILLSIITKGSRQIKKTVKLGNFSQPRMTPPPPSKLGKNI